MHSQALMVHIDHDTTMTNIDCAATTFDSKIGYKSSVTVHDVRHGYQTPSRSGCYIQGMVLWFRSG
jgi:hypothetical protein